METIQYLTARDNLNELIEKAHHISEYTTRRSTLWNTYCLKRQDAELWAISRYN